MKERNKEKREDFFPSFVVSVTHTRARKSRANPDATGTPLSLSLEREKKRASARGVCQFVKTVRRSGTSTPTDADVADAISSLSLFSNSIDSKHLLVSSKTRALCYISQKSAQDWARDFNPLFLRPVILYTKSSWIFFFLRAPYLQQTGKRHDKSIEIICKKEKKFRVMISSCHRRCERAAAEAIDACNGCVPPVTRQTPFNFSFLLILRRHSTLLPIARWFSWQPLRAN